MRKLLVILLLFVILVISNSFAQDVIVFLGDIDGADGDPIGVAFNDTIDIPMYWMCTEAGVNVASCVLPVAINDRYADYFDVSNCYADPGGLVYDWDYGAIFDDLQLNQEGYFPYDSYPDPVWHSYSIYSIMEGPPPYISRPFVSFVPELQVHYSIHIAQNMFNYDDTTCWLLAEGYNTHVGLPNMADTTGTVYWDVAYSCACYYFTGAAGITGRVTNQQGEPIEGAFVSIASAGVVDTTNYDGYYSLTEISGNLELNFQADGYADYSAYVSISPYDLSIHDAELCAFEPDAGTDITIWVGSEFEGCDWQDTITVIAGQILEIPLYFLGHPGVDVGSILYPIAINNTYIDSFAYDFCDSYYPVSNWEIDEFINLNPDYYTDSLGNTWDSYTYFAIPMGLPYSHPRWIFDGHSEPMHVLSFYVHIRDDIDFVGVYDDVIAHGYDPYAGPGSLTDTLGALNWNLTEHFPSIEIIDAFQYYPGDVNMHVGYWPPYPGLSDITYLVNYFRAMPLSVPCYQDGFWASADVNGDCLVIGSDVTYLVGTFRGARSVTYCEDYPTAWPTETEVPEQKPAGWPFCE